MAHQISIFVENKPGRIERVARILQGAGVNMRAITIATSGSFGVIKLLVDDPGKTADEADSNSKPFQDRQLARAVDALKGALVYSALEAKTKKPAPKRPAKGKKK